MEDLPGWIDQVQHLEDQLKEWDVQNKYVIKARDIKVYLETIYEKQEAENDGD